MKKNVKKIKTSVITTAILVFSMILVLGCSEDAIQKELEDLGESVEVENNEENADTSEDAKNDESNSSEGTEKPCTNVEDYIFSEKDGLVNIEFENAEFSADWKMKTDGNNFSGKGYMVWEGVQYLGNPGSAKTTFKIKIENSGTYQFIWKSAVISGSSGTDHNDSWLRFVDADDFYAQKEDSVVYPKDMGKSPNPEGASKEGWFKIYRSGNNLDFKWQASTFDNDPHDIFVVFNNAGIYTMEVSVRSSGHGIDKFVLFKEMPKQNAISDLNALSGISCN